MKTYRVFVRNWWRRNLNVRGGLLPNPGARQTTIARGLSYDAAREMCADHARTHKPGRLSRKAEFTAE